MTPKQRREVVAALREDGHSLRAISGALGVGKSTVKRDLDEPTVPRGTVPERVTGLDGKSRPATQPKLEPTRERRSVRSYLGRTRTTRASNKLRIF